MKKVNFILKIFYNYNKSISPPSCVCVKIFNRFYKFRCPKDKTAKELNHVRLTFAAFWHAIAYRGEEKKREREREFDTEAARIWCIATLRCIPIYLELPCELLTSEIESEHRRIDLHGGPITDRNRMRHRCLVTLSDRIRIIRRNANLFACPSLV